MKKHIERDFMHKLTDDETLAELEGYYGKERGAMDEEKLIFNGEGLMSKVWPGLFYEANKSQRLEWKRKELKRVLLRSLECADQIQDIVECNKRMIW